MQALLVCLLWLLVAVSHQGSLKISILEVSNTTLNLPSNRIFPLNDLQIDDTTPSPILLTGLTETRIILQHDVLLLYFVIVLYLDLWLLLL